MSIATHNPRGRRGRPTVEPGRVTGRLNLRVPDRVRAAIEAMASEREDGADISQIARELLVDALVQRGRL